MKKSGEPQPTDTKTGKGSQSKPVKEGTPIYYRYSLDKVAKIRKMLREALTYEFLDKIPKKETFTRFLELVQEILPGTVHLQTLEDSLRHVAGTTMTAEAIDSVAWRLAGNHKRLLDRKAVPPWHVQKFLEWVPVLIINCRKSRNGRGALGATFGFRILAGTSCGLIAYKWWSQKFCRFVAKDLGFTRARGRRASRFPFTAVEQLVNLRMLIRINPDLCNKEPAFDKVSRAVSMKAWNTETVKCRFRAQPSFECLMEKGPDFPCQTCPIGFLRCRAATHRHDWVAKRCEHCKKDDAMFDPEIHGDMCIDCTNKESYRSRK